MALLLHFFKFILKVKHPPLTVKGGCVPESLLNFSFQNLPPYLSRYQNHRILLHRNQY